MDTGRRSAQKSSYFLCPSRQLTVPQRVSKIVHLPPAKNDASRVAPGTVPGTVQEVVRKACPYVFLAAIGGRNLAVRGSVTCRFVRKEACWSIRTASRYSTRRAKGKAVRTATRDGTVVVACGVTWDATPAATGVMTVLGLGTRTGKAGRQSLGAPASFLEEAKAGTVPDGRQMGTVPRSACVGLSAVQSPFARDSPRFPGVTSPLA